MTAVKKRAKMRFMDWNVCDRCGVAREWTYTVCDEIVCHECSSAYEDREPIEAIWDTVADIEDDDTDEYEVYELSLAAMEAFIAASDRSRKS